MSHKRIIAAEFFRPVCEQFAIDEKELLRRPLLLTRRVRRLTSIPHNSKTTKQLSFS